MNRGQFAPSALGGQADSTTGRVNVQQPRPLRAECEWRIRASLALAERPRGLLAALSAYGAFDTSKRPMCAAPRGQRFSRLAAAAFDAYLEASLARFSAAV